MAYAAFADAPVDVAVVEVGMGGSWDATNVADGDVAVAVDAIGAAAAPRELLVVDALPLRGVGKPDRSAATALAARRLGGGAG